jgi:hypothetical protein
VEKQFLKQSILPPNKDMLTSNCFSITSLAKKKGTLTESITVIVPFFTALALKRVTGRLFSSGSYIAGL